MVAGRWAATLQGWGSKVASPKSINASPLDNAPGHLLTLLPHFCLKQLATVQTFIHRLGNFVLLLPCSDCSACIYCHGGLPDLQPGRQGLSNQQPHRLGLPDRPPRRYDRVHLVLPTQRNASPHPESATKLIAEKAVSVDLLPDTSRETASTHPREATARNKRQWRGQGWGETQLR